MATLFEGWDYSDNTEQTPAPVHVEDGHIAGLTCAQQVKGICYRNEIVP